MRIQARLFLLILAAGARGAFEACGESPWVFGYPGVLFPRSAAALALNPVTPGMLERPGLSVAAVRPFGEPELQRMSLAGNVFLAGTGVGGFLGGSTAGGYSEFTLTGALAFRLHRGLLAGVALSGRSLSIHGYGGKRGLSLDAGITARPLEGLYLAGGVRGLWAFRIAGEAAVPGAVHLAAGVVPMQGIQCAVSGAVYQHTGAEYGVQVLFRPHDRLVLGVGCLSRPPRLCFSVGVNASGTEVGYGYATHPDLPGSHMAEVAWGGTAFTPAPIPPRMLPPVERPVTFPVNINTATERELTAIPGIGPARAAAILTWLSSHGPVHDLSELLQVPGVGPSTLETLRGYLTVP